MTPRRLIRWKSFWLGILVLGFLGWSWMRSMNYSEGLRWTPSRSLTVTCFHRVGGAVLSIDKETAAHGQIFELVSKPYRPTPRTVMNYRNVTWWGTSPRHVVFIAHWILALAFLIPWSAFLAWRWQRQKKPSP